MLLRSLVVGPLGVNCYLIGCPRTRQAAIVDPGDEVPRILEAVSREGLDVRWILNTHGHPDHAGGVQAAKEATKAPYAIHPGDRMWIDDLRFWNRKLRERFFIEMPVTGEPSPDDLLAHGAEIPVGDLRIRVLATPGHTQGSACFQVGDHLFSGDTLFAGSIGRTDLPGGDGPAILASIRERLLSLPDATIVCPGHGPATTIGDERGTNPFLEAGSRP